MRVLYVCTGNSFRSPAAEALTRRFHHGMEVESAGTHPADEISGEVRELLEDDGAARYLKPHPEEVSARAVEEADRVVAMVSYHRKILERRFPESREKVEVWNVPDPVTGFVTPQEAYHRARRMVQDLSP